MKENPTKKILYIIIFLMTGILASAQGLNNNALTLKNGNADGIKIYKEIKTSAVDAWGNDHEMVLYTINNQADAAFEMSKIINSPNFDERILSKALGEWNKKINGISCIDYEMVVYTYKNQIAAKNAY